MALNPSIILGGQQPDFVNMLGRSSQAAQQNNAVFDQNRLRNTYDQHGAGIVAGEQGALNALASISPQAAMGIQQGRQGLAAGELGMAQTRQSMQHADAQQGRLSRQEERQIQAHAASMSAAERAAQVAEIERGVAMAMGAQTSEEFDAIVSQVDPSLVGQFGNRDAIAGRFLSMAEMIKRADAQDAGPKVPASIEALRMRAQEAGLQQGTPEYAQFMLEGGKKQDGMRITQDANGRMVFEQGSAVSKDPADVSNPSSPAAMIATIDGILSDPALDTATGMLSITQKIPGTGQYRFGTRVKQLEGQAFLQAFESLKGAGQITEIEGTKATQAIGRLDSAQSPADFRQALTELNDILKLAAGRPVGWAEQQSAAPQEMPSVSDQAGYDALPSGAVFIAPDGTQRRKP